MKKIINKIKTKSLFLTLLLSTIYLFLINIVSAESGKTVFANPLNNTSIQSILSGVVDTAVFILAVVGAYCAIRGGFGLLMYGKQNPEGLSKTKWWFIAAVGIWLLAFGGQYIISVIYNTATEFVDSTGNKGGQST